MRRPILMAIAAVGILGCIVATAQLQTVHGQAAPKAFAGAKAPKPVTQVPVREPRSADDVKKFLRDLSTHDATFKVFVGQGRLLTLQQDIAEKGKPSPLIAVGDPRILDFQVVGARHLRIIGRQIGMTEMSVVTSNGTDFSLEVQVVADYSLLNARLKQAFPSAQVELTQMRQHLIVSGQARDTRQISQIIAMIRTYLPTVQIAGSIAGQGGGGGAPTQQPGVAPKKAAPKKTDGNVAPAENQPDTPGEVGPQTGQPNVKSQFGAPEIINLLRVPGPQQVLLKVQIAELNRTALRQLGVSFLFQDGNSAVGQNISGGLVGGAESGAGAGAVATLLGLADPLAAGATTAFGVFDGGKMNFIFNALRRNQVLKILAEPNLVAMNGQTANFLAGGEFPVPVPQPSGGGPTVVTIEFRPFGVSLDFVPFILDGDRIRLSVQPEVSSIDFSTGVVIQGTAVPGVNTRKTSTTVEMREGQTLAISGILQVELSGTTSRIPGLGDLPYIGSMFRNTSSQSSEKELVVLVTPYLVQPMNPDQVPPKPGDDVADPTDIEVYLLGRIERRACREFRATTAWDDPLDVEKRRKVEERYVSGPYGYTQ